MNKQVAVTLISRVLFTDFAGDGFGLVRAAAAAPIVDVTARRAALAQIPEGVRRSLFHGISGLAPGQPLRFGGRWEG